MTFLSRRGYSVDKSTLEPHELAALKKDLTVAPYVASGFAGNTPSFKIYMESASKIYVPKAYGLTRFGIPSSMKISDGLDIHIPFKGVLRKEQEAPVYAFLDAAQDPLKMGGILNLRCAAGKTVMAIYLICTLGKKAMVIVHKDFLLKQWKERIEQFAPSARVGIIKAKELDYIDKDIVITSLQSLSMKDYPDDVFKEFGTLVCDECHHLGAEVFSSALQKVSFKYTLGLSATVKRKDGLSKVFMWYLGNIVYSTKTKHKDTIDVRMVPFKCDEEVEEYNKECMMYNRKPNLSKMINNICSYEPRTQYIVEQIVKTFRRENERRVLVLSDRRSHLQDLQIQLQKYGIDDVGFYFGGMKSEQLKDSEGKRVILGTFQMACIADDTPIIDMITGKEMILGDCQHHIAFNFGCMNESSEEFNIAQPLQFGYSEPKSTITFEHELGSITVSVDHPMYTNRGWLEACKVKESDYFIAPRFIDYKTKDIPTFTARDAYNFGKTINSHPWIPTSYMYLPLCKLYAMIDGIVNFYAYFDKDIDYLYLNITHQRTLYQIITILLKLGIQSFKASNLICLSPSNIINLYDILPKCSSLVAEDVYIKKLKDLNKFDIYNKIPSNIIQATFPDLGLSTMTYQTYENMCHYLDAPNACCNACFISIRSIKKNDVSYNLCDVQMPYSYKNLLITNILVHNSEGFDVQGLDTLVLASPKSDIVQSVGRILREKPEDRKHVPLVIDIIDDFSLFPKQADKRQSYYKKCKYNIIDKRVQIKETNDIKTNPIPECAFINLNDE